MQVMSPKQTIAALHDVARMICATDRPSLNSVCQALRGVISGIEGKRQLRSSSCVIESLSIKYPDTNDGGVPAQFVVDDISNDFEYHKAMKIDPQNTQVDPIY